MHNCLHNFKRHCKSEFREVETVRQFRSGETPMEFKRQCQPMRAITQLTIHRRTIDIPRDSGARPASIHAAFQARPRSLGNSLAADRLVIRRCGIGLPFTIAFVVTN